ncbi:MAG: hypothetical protein WC028_28360 [Candidatus Obscuribacterales bacterium]
MPAPHRNEFEKIVCSGRWHFLDGEKGPEAVRKALALKQIDRFWSEFKASKLCQVRARAALRDNIGAPWMFEHFPIAEPPLEWELGFDQDELSELSICRSEGFSQLRLTETFVERAGVIDGWKIYAGRVPLDLSRIDIRSAFESRWKRRLPPFTFELFKTPSNHIEIKFYSNEFRVESEDDDQATVFYLCETLLGEQVSDRWVGLRETLFDENLTVSDFDFKAKAEAFQTAFADMRQSILDELPEQPYALWDCTRDFTTLQVATPAQIADTSRDRRRWTIMTFWPEIFMGLSNRLFFSERFLKNGQRFAYLHLLDIIPEFSNEFRERFEDDIISALAAAEAGCMVGCGRGNPDSYYFDLCLTDVAKAIEVLREVCQRANLPSTCWLRFYDWHWSQDWVRMFPDTPDLEDPERLG